MLDDFGGGTYAGCGGPTNTPTNTPTRTPTPTNTPVGPTNTPTPTPTNTPTPTPTNTSSGCPTSDDFNRTDNTNLGSNWNERRAGFGIVTNTLRNDTTNTDIIASWNCGPYGNAVVSSQVLIVNNNGTVNVGARWGNYDANGYPQQGYNAEILSNGTVKLWRISDWTQLGSTYTISGFSLNTWYTLALRANGNQISVEVNGSAVIGPITDGTWTSGDAGLWSYQPNTVGNHRFDNFSVTVLGGGLHTKTKGLAMIRARSLAVVTAPPANTTWRVYYYAAGKPIAMREMPAGNNTGTLYYLHSDHLGSTSVTTCGSGTCGAAGNVVARQWYYPFGAVRASSGTLPTQRTFTGQYSHDAGLGSIMHFGARMYSPALGRFLSADSIVPQMYDPQSLNRYSYVVNRPTVFVDPTGHTYLCKDECDAGGWRPGLSHYGVVLTGDWSVEHTFAVLNGVVAVAAELGEVAGMTAVAAFRAVYGIDEDNPMIFDWDPSCSDCRPLDCGSSYVGRCKPQFGHTDSARRIEFATMSGFSDSSRPDGGYAERTLRQRNNVVHELGHAFENRIAYKDSADSWRKPAREALPFANRDGLATGNAWRQSSDSGTGEIYADMYLGWTSNTWASSPRGQAYQQWMNRNMPLWIDLAISK